MVPARADARQLTAETPAPPRDAPRADAAGEREGRRAVRSRVGVPVLGVGGQNPARRAALRCAHCMNHDLRSVCALHLGHVCYVIPAASDMSTHDPAGPHYMTLDMSAAAICIDTNRCCIFCLNCKRVRIMRRVMPVLTTFLVSASVRGRPTAEDRGSVGPAGDRGGERKQQQRLPRPPHNINPVLIPSAPQWQRAGPPCVQPERSEHDSDGPGPRPTAAGPPARVSSAAFDRRRERASGHGCSRCAAAPRP